MNFETRQRCGTCPPIKQNKTRFTCQLSVPTMLAGIDHFQVFCKDYSHPWNTNPRWFPGVVATWYLSENHVMVMVRVSFLFPCWCLDIVKIDKTALIYSFHISIWGAWSIVWRLSPPNPPVATGLAVCETWKSIAVARSIWVPNNCRKAFAHFGQVYLMCPIFVKNFAQKCGWKLQ